MSLRDLSTGPNRIQVYHTLNIYIYGLEYRCPESNLIGTSINLLENKWLQVWSSINSIYNNVPNHLHFLCILWFLYMHVNIYIFLFSYFIAWILGFWCFGLQVLENMEKICKLNKLDCRVTSINLIGFIEKSVLLFSVITFFLKL